MFEGMDMQTVIAAIVAAGLFMVGASEWHDYNKRATVCHEIETLAIAFNRELSPDHKCREYLD